jgi:hypothetical protein
MQEFSTKLKQIGNVIDTAQLFHVSSFSGDDRPQRFELYLYVQTKETPSDHAYIKLLKDIKHLVPEHSYRSWTLTYPGLGPDPEFLLLISQLPDMIEHHKQRHSQQVLRVVDGTRITLGWPLLALLLVPKTIGCFTEESNTALRELQLQEFAASCVHTVSSELALTQKLAQCLPDYKPVDATAVVAAATTAVSSGNHTSQLELYKQRQLVSQQLIAEAEQRDVGSASEAAKVAEYTASVQANLDGVLKRSDAVYAEWKKETAALKALEAESWSFLEC